MIRDMLKHPHTLTFDCWATLIYERGAGRGHAYRIRALVEALPGRPATWGGCYRRCAICVSGDHVPSVFFTVCADLD